MSQWYESMFENYAENYEKESFTQGTTGETDFIEKEAGYDKSIKILDIGCGTGRHSVELARRGYDVTGIDLSEAQLSKAREKAETAAVSVSFNRMDARAITYRNEFDLAIMICEGAFPLMETDDMNYQILRGAAAALKDNGKLIMTTLNGLYPLRHSTVDIVNDSATGEFKAIRSEFDLMTFRDANTFEIVDDGGVRKQMISSERYYVPSEMTWLLKSAGFATVDIFGCRLGAFSREDKLTPEDFEMLIVAEK